MDPQRKKIFVALSGGVDSAVAAALLKKQGHEVVGVNFAFFGSTWKLSFQVKRIAEKLGIPLKIVDARKEFQKRVIDYFVSSYKNGLTPNPCVVCNKEMKFRMLFDLMKKEKANYIATGHYARIKVRPAIQGSTCNPRFDLSLSRLFAGKFLKVEPFRISQGRTLCEAKDKTKDQSYFLYKLSQRELSKIIFPLGNYAKDEVRKIAKKLRLPISDGEESQDICFFNGSLSNFLKKKLKLKKASPPASLREQAHLRSVAGGGNIIDEKGKILGKHKGLPLYTIGQRKGIEIGPPTSRQEREAIRASGPGPYFTLGKNLKKNELIVTNDPKKLLAKSFQVGKVNWISEKIKLPLKAKVQIRYHADKIPAIITLGTHGRLIITTKKPVRAVTSGQSVVFYRGEELLGGGIIS